MAWKAPANYDAAFCGNIGDNGLGAIIRGYKSNFCAIAASHKSRVSNALMTEGWIVLEELQLAFSLGLSSIVIKSNCLNLDNFVNEGHVLLSYSGLLIQEIINLSRFFISFLSVLFLELVIKLSTVSLPMGVALICR